MCVSVLGWIVGSCGVLYTQPVSMSATRNLVEYVTHSVVKMRPGISTSPPFTRYRDCADLNHTISPLHAKSVGCEETRSLGNGYGRQFLPEQPEARLDRDSCQSHARELPACWETVKSFSVAFDR